MYWILQKALQTMGKRYIHRALQYQASWVNNGVEIVELPEGEKDIVFNRFLFETEKYPCIIMAAGSAEPQAIGIGDYIESTSPIKVQWTTAEDSKGLQWGSDIAGVETRINTGELTKVASLDFSFYRPPGLGVDPVRVFVELSWEESGPFNGGPTLASGTGTIYPHSSPQDINIPLNTEIVIDPERQYTVRISIEESLSSSSCYLLHSSGTGSYGEGAGSSTIPGKVLFQGVAAKNVRGISQKILGGYNNIPLSATVVAKDVDTSRKIADVVFLYFAALKQADLLRGSTTGLNLELVTSSEFSRAGIYVVQNPRIDSSERKRSQENLYLTTVTVSLLCPWRIGFLLPLLRELDVDISSYPTT